MSWKPFSGDPVVCSAAHCAPMHQLVAVGWRAYDATASSHCIHNSYFSVLGPLQGASLWEVRGACRAHAGALCNIARLAARECAPSEAAVVGLRLGGWRPSPVAACRAGSRHTPSPASLPQQAARGMGNCCGTAAAANDKDDVRRNKSQRLTNWSKTGVVALRRANLAVRSRRVRCGSPMWQLRGLAVASAGRGPVLIR